MQLRPNKRIELYSVQDDFVWATERFTAFVGGIGSGKTYAGAVKALIESRESGSLGLVISPTYPMLRDATLRTYQEIFGRAFVDFNKGEMLAVLPNGGEILFRSADNPDRLRGPNISYCHIDEGALCHRQTWDVVIGRLRAGGKAGRCWVTTTPKGRKNWVYEKRDQMTMFRSATRRNPYLNKDFVSSLEKAYTGAFAAQELEGEFVSFEGVIYDEFTDKHVLTRDLGEFVEFVVGVDEGYTNPAVALVIGVDADKRLHVVEEYYQRHVMQETFVMICQDISARYERPRFYVDPSAAGLIASMRAANLLVSDANNAVNDGIQTVKARMSIAGDGRPRLTIAPAAANTIAEVEAYAWATDKNGDALDKPLKENDHAMDALRYATMGVAHKRSLIIQGVSF